MAGRKKKGSEQVGDAYQGLQDAYINTGTSMAQATRSTHLGYADDAKKAQDQLMQDMADIRQAEANRWANYAGGVEAMIGEREKEIARAQQEAVADYNASQRAAQATGMTHLASSIANLIGVGGFNASNQVYQNPSMDWMKKADQDKFINRQRIDNMRERQRAIQQHLLDIKAQGEGALIGYDREAANIRNQFAMNMAGARRDADLAAARYEAEGAVNAAQAGAQGAQAVASARNQEASLGLQQDRLNAEKDRYAAQMRAQGYNPDGSPNPAYMQEAQVVAGRPVGGTGTTRSSASGGGSSTSGNNYAVTVDGQRIVLGMNTETFNAAMQSGKKDIQQDVMDEAGFKGTWDEFVEAASQSKVGKGKDRKDNPLAKYSEIIAALNYNGSDQDEAKSMNAVLEDYVTRNSDTANNFNKHLVNVSNRQRDAVYTSQANQQAVAGAATTPSQQARGRAPEQPTRVEVRDGKLVTVDTATGEVLHEGGSAAPQPQQTWEDKVKWK